MGIKLFVQFVQDIFSGGSEIRYRWDFFWNLRLPSEFNVTSLLVAQLRSGQRTSTTNMEDRRSEKNNKVSDCITQEIRATEVLPERKDRTVLILLYSSFPHCDEWFTKVGATAMNHISIFLVSMLASLVFSLLFLFPSNANWSPIFTQCIRSKMRQFFYVTKWLVKETLFTLTTFISKNKESHINAKNYFALRFSRVGDILPHVVVAYWLSIYVS